MGAPAAFFSIWRGNLEKAMKTAMKTASALYLSLLALAIGTVPVTALAQVAAKAPIQSESAFGALPGRWVRPDGGYVISIKSVDASGKLDAAYTNPNPLPFARAEATQDGKIIKLFFELRAGGYNGSTYTLTYDPAVDVLKGVYYQAVAQQKFDVYFTRAK
jgi:uncharacterized protein (DUF2147 family)